MTEMTLGVELPASAEKAFHAVTDWERQSEWIFGTKVRVIEGDGQSVGSRIVARTALGPLGFDDPMEITVWEPPRRCHVQHLGRVVRGEGRFEVEALGAARSRFIWSELLDLPLGRLGQAGFVAVRPMASAGLQMSLMRLARQLKS